MKTLRISTIIMLFALFNLQGCKEDELELLPPITAIGANTFGCIIDGSVLLPLDGKDSFSGTGADGLDVNYRLDSNLLSLSPPYFAIRSSYNSKGGDLIYIYIPSLLNSDTFIINESNGLAGIYSPPNVHALANVYNSKKEFQDRYLSFENSGYIHVTHFDTINTIISGTFEMKMIDAETMTDTIEITDGRFDINWRTLNCGTSYHQDCPE